MAARCISLLALALAAASALPIDYDDVPQAAASSSTGEVRDGYFPLRGEPEGEFAYEQPPRQGVPAIVYFPVAPAPAPGAPLLGPSKLEGKVGEAPLFKSFAPSPGPAPGPAPFVPALVLLLNEPRQPPVEQEPPHYDEQEPQRYDEQAPQRYDEQEPQRYDEQEPQQQQEQEPQQQQEQEPQRYDEQEPLQGEVPEPSLFQQPPPSLGPALPFVDEPLPKPVKRTKLYKVKLTKASEPREQPSQPDDLPEQQSYLLPELPFVEQPPQPPELASEVQPPPPPPAPESSSPAPAPDAAAASTPEPETEDASRERRSPDGASSSAKASSSAGASSYASASSSSSYAAPAGSSASSYASSSGNAGAGAAAGAGAGDGVFAAQPASFGPGYAPPPPGYGPYGMPTGFGESTLLNRFGSLDEQGPAAVEHSGAAQGTGVHSSASSSIDSTGKVTYHVRAGKF